MNRMQERLLLDSAMGHVEQIFAAELPPEFTYHDFTHTLQVYKAAEELANMAGLHSENRLLLLIAAIFHDVGYIRGPALHEQRSAQMASEFLADKGFSGNSIARVREMILATGSREYRPQGLSDYLRDADLSYLGLPGFLNRAEIYRTELVRTGITHGAEKEWLQFNLAFFRKHRYLTPEARSAFGPHKSRHQLLLEEMLRNCPD